MIKKILFTLWGIITVFFILYAQIQAMESAKQEYLAQENLKLAEECAKRAEASVEEALFQAARAEKYRLQLDSCQNQ